MLENHEMYYAAMKSGDIRFDGRFFIGVHTTGIYCRPICPAPSPKPENVSFYRTAASAKKAGLRPCLRCRPESSPGTSEWDAVSSVISQSLRLISSGYLNTHSVAELANQLNLSDRQIRRLFEKHLGASPLEIAQTQRLHFAKKLINETNLKMVDVAYSSGFSSLRRFNAVIKQTYGRSPKSLRDTKQKNKFETDNDLLMLNLDYRPPYDWQSMLNFLQMRLIPGVEQIGEGKYSRIVQIGDQAGIITVHHHANKPQIVLQVSPNLAADLFAIVERVKRIFDLSAIPEEINNHLKQDTSLASIIDNKPGLRLPGAWDGFELTVRAILGQQISVKAANTLTGRIVEKFGESINLPNVSNLKSIFPTPNILAKADLQGLGITGQRARAINALSTEVAMGKITFDGLKSPEETVKAIREVVGIGDWTAQYIAMRVLGDPDAFPASDLGLRKAMSAPKSDRLISVPELNKLAEPWRPWRAYAAIHLWDSLSGT